MTGERGPQGETGKQGDRGERGAHGIGGLSGPVRKALVYMFVLSVLLNCANFLWSARQQHAYETTLARDHAAHLRQDAALVGHLCLTFGKLGALKPPAGNPVKNPARGYDQQLHVTLVQLGADLGCK